MSPRKRELGTLEVQHDRPRLSPPRLRDASAKPLPPAPAPKRGAPRPFRAARRTLLASTRAAASRVLGADGSPLASAQIAAEALKLFRAGKRELGTQSPTALVALHAWALQSATSAHLTLLAADAPPDRQLALYDQAARSVGRAERSWVMAITAAGMLGARSAHPSPRRLPSWLTNSDGEGES